MKKILIVLISLALLFSFTGMSSAQETSGGQGAASAFSGTTSSMPELAPLRYSGSALPLGQNHYYTVNLRGNGQALIFLKTVIPNIESASVSAVKYTFPVPPQNLSVFQAYREPQCVTYDPMPYLPDAIMDNTGTDNGTAPDGSNSMRIYRPPVQKCAQYQDPDYQYGWGNTTYHKADFFLNNKELLVTLPKSIKPNGNGSIILVYTLTNITDKGLLGEYNFSFDTIKVQDSIQNLQVGITVDPDYYLKDAKGEINYQTKEASPMSAPSSIALDRGGVSNPQFDQFYSQIGTGTIVKTANNLQSNETYTVKGVYADSKIKLYGSEIVKGIAVIVFILVLALGSLFIAVKKVFGNKDSKSARIITGKNLPILVVISASFGSSLLILLYSVGLYFLSIYFNQIFPNYNYNSLYPLLLILLTIISLCLYILFLFMPGIIIGIKKGLVTGLAAIVLTIFWLIFYGIVIAVISFLFSQNNTIYQIPLPASVGIERGTSESGNTYKTQ